jgi:hypothetical protein
MRRDLVLGVASLVSGLFAIPSIVFSGGSLLAGAALALLAVLLGLGGLRSERRPLRALAIAGFVLGVASLWYALTGWAVSLDIAQAVSDLF